MRVDIRPSLPEGSRVAKRFGAASAARGAACAILAAAAAAGGCSHGDSTERLGAAAQAVGPACATVQRAPGLPGAVEDTLIVFDPTDPVRANTAYGAVQVLQDGTVGTAYQRVLLRFDLGAIDVESTVTSATLTFRMIQSLGKAPVDLYTITSPWTESAATWNNFGGFDPAVVTSIPTLGVPNNSGLTIDLTGVAAGWVAAPQTNFGVLFDHPLPGRTKFASSEAPNVALRPKLQVCYLAPTCSDGIQNQAETGIDCGGPCAPCPTCSDGIQNQGETGVDCGGPCTPCPTCSDGIQNQGETGLDCGGPACGPCADGEGCASGLDCLGGVCASGICVTPPLCVPAPETCNGLDDDCDGAIDEDPGICGACTGCLVNEVLFWADPTSSDPDLAHEWIEITNAGGAPGDLGGMRVTDGSAAGGVALPPVVLPPGAFLVIHYATGADDLDFSDGAGAIYTGDDPASTDALDDVTDSAALFAADPPSAATILDYVGWHDHELPFAPDAAQGLAVAAGIWTAGDFVSPLSARSDAGEPLILPVAGLPIGRSAASTDTDLPADFHLGGLLSGGATPGAGDQIPVFWFIPYEPAPPPPALAQWTVMAFVNSESNLEPWFARDVLAMQRVGSTDQVNLVVQFDGAFAAQGVPAGDLATSVPGTGGSAFRFRIVQGGWDDPHRVLMEVAPSDQATQGYRRGEVDMGSSAELGSFIGWARQNYPAQHYALFIGGHGLGWQGTSYDATYTFPRTFLDMERLRDGLAASTPKGLDLIAFHSCFMGAIEVAHEVAPFAHYMVGSEDVAWTVFDYEEVLGPLVADPVGASAVSLGTDDVTSYAAAMASRDDWTMSLVSLDAELDALVAATSSLGDTLLTKIDTDLGDRCDPVDNAQIRVQGQRAVTMDFNPVPRLDTRDYMDLGRFADLVNEEFGAITDVPAKMSAALVANAKGAKRPWATGLSIYFPEHQDSYDLPDWDLYAANDDCEPPPQPQLHLWPQTPQLRFRDDTSWDEFLQRYYEPVAVFELFGEGETLCDGVTICPDVHPAVADFCADASGASDTETATPNLLIAWDLNTLSNDSSYDSDHDCDDDAEDDTDASTPVITGLSSAQLDRIRLMVTDDHHQNFTLHAGHYQTDDYVCPLQSCVTPSYCTNSILDLDETDTDCGGTICAGCADGAVCLVDADCLSGSCSLGHCGAPLPACGNGVLELGETCDDGNTTDGDGCDSNCTPSGCGNGIAVPGEPCFLATGPFATGASPVAIAVGDLDVDGLLDVVTANKLGNTIGVLRGAGGGALLPPAFFAVGGQPSAITLSDFNADGVPDVATANAASSNVTVLTGTGNGSFAVSATVPAGFQPKGIAAALVDSDGHMDIVVANSAFSVGVFGGNGDGTFQAQVQSFMADGASRLLKKWRRGSTGS
jgi:cysteine-rich repeat protein